MKLIKTFLFASALFSAQMTFAQFKQSALPYGYGAFEDKIDAKTMEIHYSKHAAAYTSNLNKAIAGTATENQSIEQILAKVSGQSAAVRNNGGGHYNHELFWSILTPEANTKPSAALAKAITQTFGSVEAMQEKINAAGAARFGSGWSWLSVDKNGKLFISSTPNQDNPLMDVVEEKGTPILGLDIWEHAYYLKYQNKRADYLTAIWGIINWKEVSNRYEQAIKKSKK